MRYYTVNKKKLTKALEKVVESFPYEKVKEMLVRYDDEGDGYCMYEQYVIKETDTGAHIEKLGTHTEKTFSTIRYAVSWATMDKRNQLHDARRLVELDRLLTDALVNIKLYEKYTRTSKDPDAKCIYLDKLMNNVAKKKKLQAEMDSLANRAREWQLLQFEQSSYK